MRMVRRGLLVRSEFQYKIEKEKAFDCHVRFRVKFLNFAAEQDVCKIPFDSKTIESLGVLRWTARGEHRISGNSFEN